jgi:site-specific DNA-methyltransferase (adenine-specific)
VGNLKPYYEDEAVTIYHGDCKAILPQLPDKSVDLVLTDPPYDIPTKSCGFDGGRRFLTRLHQESLTSSFDIGLLDLLANKLKILNIVCFCNKAQFRLYVNWIESHGYSFMPISWHKTGAIPFKHHYTPDTEYAFHIWQNLPIRWASYKKSWFITPINHTGFDHPTVKPESMVSRLLLNTTDQGQLILDPFLGSGTTAFCAKKLGRRCIGIEIEEKYCEMAAKRCSQGVLDLVTENGRRCYVCGTPLNGRRTDSGYCSNRCRQKAYRQRLLQVGVTGRRC